MSSISENEQFRILVIEDDQDIRELIVLQLQLRNHMAFAAASAKEAMDKIQNDNYDLFIVDRMLPDSTGLDICRSLRTNPKTQECPVILVTAMAEPENIIEGLDAGADDYITKPFDIDVLHARVRAQLRRIRNVQVPPAPTDPDDAMNFGSLSIDEKRCRVKLGEEEVKLTHTELQILISLAKNPGVVYKRRDLIDQILGGDVHVTNRTIDTHIAGLRKKLGEEASLIETIRGVGYRFQDQ